ncbi:MULTISPECIES: tRNA pseudouridine(55) synthase TruB [unclassified Guyparkeria]|uniref:tRNA pseudouridine(55) synthase TruB n=1 Tax=unclassified Guyparkeria TaxID=2626246 RepID=UPI0007334EC3|nr:MULTISPECIES: tRNA pseudouridine(55) synthase TruB [unclassified Guyparkeria]KTG16513.1 tRNA pseudouridine synthase B [Guyparkeria sp. XI15]OAE85453.1 tRNA pseudouridine synthase B [Guyparkeria sp. WRN-7]
MARKRRGREINGIVLFDKSLGLSSNRALQRVRRLFNAAKAGHTGSLDPAASGLLPVCFGQATRISGLLLDADKTYRVTGRLGTRTDSGDLEGEVIETREVPPLDVETMETVLARFRGRVEQVPPMYSALKHEGKRLYELAREGKTVERKARTIDFHEITLEGLSETEFTLRVHSSKGAYIRTLVEDVGEAIGCGAVVTELRRVGLGPWSIDADDGQRAYTFEDLEALSEEGGLEALDRVILPIDSALGAYPAVVLDATSVTPIRHGHPVFVPNAPQTGWFRLYAPDDLFLGMGEVLDDGRTAPRRLFAAL